MPHTVMPRNVLLEDLLDRLPPDAAVVDFLEFTKSTPPPGKKGAFDTTRSLIAFVARPGQDVQMFDLGPVAPVTADIDAWRKSLGSLEEGVQAGRRLRERLWEPLLPYLENANMIIVSPDGVIGRLPLGSRLPGMQPDTYLIEDHRLALTPSPNSFQS